MKYIVPFKRMYEKWYLTILCLSIIFLSMFFIGVVSVRYSLQLMDIAMKNTLSYELMQQQVISSMQNMFLFMVLIFIINEGFLWTLGERIMHRKLSFFNSWFRWLIITIIASLFLLIFSLLAYFGLSMNVYYFCLFMLGYFTIIAYSSIHHKWKTIGKSIFNAGFKKSYLSIPFYLIPLLFYYYFVKWAINRTNVFTDIMVLAVFGIVYLIVRLYWIYLYGEILSQ